MAGTPKYPNQQLSSVSLETFFSGQFTVLSRLEKVQARVKERLPLLFVPNAESGEALALRPYQLRDVAGVESLAIALNQVTYVSFVYPGYQTLAQTAVPLLAETLEILDVPELQRVAYRYENEIGLTRDEHEVLPLSSILKLDMPSWCGDDFTAFELSWQKKWAKGQVGSHARVEQVNGVEVLKLTVVAVVLPAGKTEDLRLLADCAHSEAVSCFESMITDEFRSYISNGGTLE